MLRITVEPERHVGSADLGLEVHADRVAVPAEVGAILKQMRVSSADQLVATLRSFPSEFMAGLGWNLADFERARDHAFAQLRGHVDAELLEEREPPEHHFGAFPPRRRR